MSSRPDGTDGTADPVAHSFIHFWDEYLRGVDDETRRLLGRGLAPGADSRSTRQWLDALGLAVDDYLRSRWFLGAMRDQLQATIRLARSVQASMTQNAAHESSSEQSWWSEASWANPSCPLARPANWAGAGTVSEGPLGQLPTWRRFLAAQERACQRLASGGASTPSTCVHSWGTCRLLRYQGDSPPEYAEPLLVCFSLINRPYILDLQPDRSVIRRLLEGGLDVYLVDWGVPSDLDRSRRLEDYIRRDIGEAVRAVRSQSRADRVHLLGYCMGGTMAAAYTALDPDSIASLGLMAAPIDFEADQGLLRLWAQEEWLDVDGLVDAFGNCPGWLLQHCFGLTRPVQNYLEKYLALADRAEDDAFLENFFAMERWVSDSVPVAGEAFRELIKLLYRQNRLVRGEYTIGGQAINLHRITCPALILLATGDHLVAPAATRAISRSSPAAEITEMTIDAGHIGLAVSSKAHRQLWPAVAKWYTDRSTALAVRSSND